MLKSTFQRHGRFVFSFAIGLALWGLTHFTPLDGVLQAVSGVNGFSVSYLTMMFVLMWRTSHDDLRRHAEADDEGAAIILIIAILAAGVSLASIFMVLNRKDLNVGEALFALAAAPLGWATLHVLAAFRYAHLYYAPDPDGGLDFPGTKAPDIWDFLYFSFTIGMTAQVSDVVVTSGRLRKLVIVHGIGSFFFNTVILALAVNAGLALSK